MPRRSPAEAGTHCPTVIPAKAGTHCASAPCAIQARCACRAAITTTRSFSAHRPSSRHAITSYPVIPAKAGTQAHNAWALQTRANHLPVIPAKAEQRPSRSHAATPPRHRAVTPTPLIPSSRRTPGPSPVTHGHSSQGRTTSPSFQRKLEPILLPQYLPNAVITTFPVCSHVELCTLAAISICTTRQTSSRTTSRKTTPQNE